MLRGGARQAVATGAKKEDDPSVATAQFLAAFHAMTQHEQERGWSDRTGHGYPSPEPEP